MALFSSSNDNTFLGVDIGDSSLKMVELKKKGKRVFLSNYAFSENVEKVNFTKLENTTYLAKAVNKLKDSANIKAKKVTASLPTFAVFSSIVNISGVDSAGLRKAVEDEAKKLIPIPLEEMILDWKIIPKTEKEKQDKKAGTKVFLTGSPKKLVKKYLEIFKKAKLELVGLETETFSLVRSLLGDDPNNTLIVEIGANSTDLTIVKNSIPVLNRSLEVCGTTVTKALAEKLEIDFLEAEQFKLDLQVTLNDKKNEEIPQLILSTISPIIQEIEYMKEFFESRKGEKIEKIVLSGSGGLLLNFDQYLSNRLNMQVIVGDPFSRLYYPKELKDMLMQIGPKLAVATGLAMRSVFKKQ